MFNNSLYPDSVIEFALDPDAIIMTAKTFLAAIVVIGAAIAVAVYVTAPELFETTREQALPTQPHADQLDGSTAAEPAQVSSIPEPEAVDELPDAIASEDAPMIGAGMASIADAKIALEQAHEAVQTAQDEYDRIELEVDGMNVYIADMEARGESPLEHQDEIMDRFQPVLAEYLDAEVRMEEALKAYEQATAKLAAARRSTGLDSSR